MTSTRLLAGITAGTLVVGCASVNSTRNGTQPEGGLVYYMPMRDVVLTVTNTAGALSSIIATPSASYADRSKSYVLEYQSHPLAKNTLDVEVNEAGLLSNSKSNQTGDAVAALGALGTIAGYVRGFGFGVQSDAAKIGTTDVVQGACTLDGTHTFIIPVTTSKGTICADKIKYEISKLSPGDDPKFEPAQADGRSYAGVFYRLNKPYKVRVYSEVLNSETIIFSPSESREYFLPIAKTFFSNNDSKITLANGAGVPSKYVQDTDGEVAALLKLPAAIIAPYFAAIGQVLSGISSQSTGQTTAMGSSLSLELAKMKYESCLKAIEAKDTALILSLQCGGG